MHITLIFCPWGVLVQARFVKQTIAFPEEFQTTNGRALSLSPWVPSAMRNPSPKRYLD